MWLLDANMDVHLLSLFSAFGIPCESSIDRGRLRHRSAIHTLR
jgi:hypothetical protein